MRDFLKKAMVEALAKAGVSAMSNTIVLEHPADLTNGDYSTSVALQYSKHLGKNPRALAEELISSLCPTLGVGQGVAKIEAAGPGFINFYLAPGAIAESLEEARSHEKWGANATLSGKKIMVEYTDPNPFKEFHIGHLMSNAIGESIARLLQFSGAEVIRANYQGDVGPHVAKAIYAYKYHSPSVSNDVAKWGLSYKIGNHLYETNEEAKQEIDKINKCVYDRSDPEVNELYDLGRKVSLEHFEELYKMLGTKFDHYFFESETAPRGVALVEAHADIFEKSDGAIVYKGENEGLHTRVFITSKGLPTYETKDLGLAQMKMEKYQLDSSITVTAHEQSDYFKVVLAAMRKVLPDIAPKIRHVSHGMMRFAEGKMSSRTGNVITGESLLLDLTEAAKVRAVESRAEDTNKLAEQVAVAAIKYQILRQTSDKDIIFDRERALSLEGDSGPYLQYAHARTNAIIEKAEEQGVDAKVDPGLLQDDLSRLLHRFPEIIEYATSLYEPHILTNYLIEIASRFNSWYAQEQILDGTPKAAHKVAVVDAVRHTLKNGLWILSIPSPEKM